MKFSTRYYWLMTVVLLAVGAWYALSQRGGSPDSETSEAIHPPDVRSKTDRTHGVPPARPPRPPRDGEVDLLANVNSPLARRYLRFMLPGSRLDGQSHDRSIVHNAFKQAWGVAARIDLTGEQQDRLAEFLLREDWTNWNSIDPERVEKWAKDHLSGEQLAELLAFIEEARQGQRNLSNLRMKMKQREHGVGTPEEAFTAEMRQSKRIADMLAMDTDNLPEEEVAKMRKELKELMKAAVTGKDDAETEAIAGSRKDEHAAQFFNLLADRIPMSEEQQLAVYDALRAGSRPPVNPYDYQSRPPQQVEEMVRADTSWLGGVLTEPQYETYLRHFLAEIEMIGFQVSR